MAARLNRNHAELVRRKIQAVHLVKLLQDHAFGRVEMTKTQVHSAIFLVNKITPNPPEQKDVNLSGQITVQIVDPTRRANPN